MPAGAGIAPESTDTPTTRVRKQKTLSPVITPSPTRRVSQKPPLRERVRERAGVRG